MKIRVIIFTTLIAAAAHAQLRSPNPIVATKTVRPAPKRAFGPTYTRRLAPLPSRATLNQQSVPAGSAGKAAKKSAKVKKK